MPIGWKDYKEAVDGSLIVTVTGGIIIAIFLVTGLFVRYSYRQPEAGLALLWGVPATATLMLALVLADLASGGHPSAGHSPAIVGFAIIVTYSRHALRWLDHQFAYRFTGRPAPARRVPFGAAHARRQRRGWLRHLGAWAIGSALLGVGILLGGGTDRASSLIFAIKLWSVILVVDFAISLSYTFFPRKTDRHEFQVPPSGI